MCLLRTMTMRQFFSAVWSESVPVDRTMGQQRNEKGGKTSDLALTRNYDLLSRRMWAHMSVICAEIISELDRAERRDFVIRKIKTRSASSDSRDFPHLWTLLRAFQSACSTEKGDQKTGSVLSSSIFFSLHSFTFTSCARLTHIMLLAQMRIRINCQQQRVVCREKRRKETTTMKKKSVVRLRRSRAAQSQHIIESEGQYFTSRVCYFVFISPLSLAALRSFATFFVVVVVNARRECTQKRLPTSSRFHLMMINFFRYFLGLLSRPHLARRRCATLHCSS